MWQYCRSITSNYYHTFGSTAALFHLIIIKHVQYCRSITSNYYHTCASNVAISHLIIPTHVAVLPHFHI